MRVKRTSATIVLALVAAVVLATGTATASSWMTISPAGEVSATSSGALSFTAGGVTVRCNATLTGSFDDGVMLIERDPFGAITASTWSGCSGGELAGSGHPWTTGYRSFLGTVPSFTGLLFNLLEATLRATVAGLRCVYRGDVGALVTLTGSGPSRTGSITLLGNEIALREGALCPATGRLTGTLALSPTQELTYGEAAQNTYSTTPAEASEPNLRIDFGSVRVNSSKAVDLTIRADMGAWRFQGCQISEPAFFDWDTMGICFRFIDANRVRTRTMRVIFRPGTVPNVTRNGTLRLIPLPDIRLTGRSIP
jgi:hypothetical protein